MAQSFSVKFYKSRAWLKFRDMYISSVHGVCERCGEPGYIVHHKIILTPQNIDDPYITLNSENVIYLCKDCHEWIHRAHFDSDGHPVPEEYAEPEAP